ncbi:hypothetical protein FN846DRAFT_942608, partial [Sphaerosporella brunnea]
MCTQTYIVHTCSCKKHHEFTQCRRRLGTIVKCKPVRERKSHDSANYCVKHLIASDMLAEGDVFNLPENLLRNQQVVWYSRMLMQLVQDFLSSLLWLAVSVQQWTAGIHPFPGHPQLDALRGSHLLIAGFVLGVFFWFF